MFEFHSNAKTTTLNKIMMLFCNIQELTKVNRMYPITKLHISNVQKVNLVLLYKIKLGGNAPPFN